MADEIKDQRIVVLMTPSELEAIDAWGFAHRIRSRGEAIRRLCQMGLDLAERMPRLEQLKAEVSNSATGVGKAMQQFQEADDGVALQDTDYFDRMDDLIGAAFGFNQEVVILNRSAEVAARDAETEKIVEKAARLREQIAEYSKKRWGV